VRLRHGGAGDAHALLALFDDAIAWMVARGQTGQWAGEPFSAQPAQVERARRWAARGGLWFASPEAGEGGDPMGAIVVGDAHGHIPPAERPELYVQVLLLTATAWRGRGVGALLITASADSLRRGSSCSPPR
jgi:GNAT superfamily N-acetyltransferase